MRWGFVIAAAITARPVSADSMAGGPEPVRATSTDARQPIVEFRVAGDSKLNRRTLAQLAHLALGDRISRADIPRIVADLWSSELFEQIAVTLEDAPGGVVVVATLDDKLSWIVAPTLFVLPGERALGLGYAENNLWGDNKKLLIYGQLGTQESLLFATFLDPSVRGTRLTARYDLYAYSRVNTEYANPVDDPTSAAIARTSRANYLGGALLTGWRFRWWLTSDLRIRGGHVSFVDAQTADDPPVPLAPPQRDGWDITAQWRTTLDRRGHRHGVTWGPFAELTLEASVPGLDVFHYQTALLRAYQSWRLFAEHQLELRTHFQVGRRIPFHQEPSLGGAIDLRGYAVDRYHGDTRVVVRSEYSVPLAKWRLFAFRAIGFWDSGHVSWQFRRNPDRDYLAGQRAGAWFRNDVGLGLRIYVKSVVLPLLGLDVAYGLEGRAAEVYFEVGLTDF